MGIQIILTKDVTNLGSLGDELVVKGGYARNYLIPQGLAIFAKGKNASELRHRCLHLQKLRDKAIGVANVQVDAIEKLELSLKAKAGKGGKLFGSITNREISGQLGLLGQSIDRRQIVLTEPIRSLGSHTVIIKLHSQVQVKLDIKVVAEEPAVVDKLEKSPESELSDQAVTTTQKPTDKKVAAQKPTDKQAADKKPATEISDAKSAQIEDSPPADKSPDIAI